MDALYSSSIREIKRLITKGMSTFTQKLLLRKAEVLKTYSLKNLSPSQFSDRSK